MKNIIILSLVMILSVQPFNTYAVLSPKIKNTPSVTQRKTFKEKAAIWLFRRKIKKALKKNIIPVVFDSTNCTTLTLNTGADYQIKLLSIDKTTITFLPCQTELKTPLTLHKNKIKKITLSDGLVIYDHNQPKATNNKVWGGLALTTGILAIFLALVSPGAGLFFAILSLIFGITSLHKGNNASGLTGIVVGIIAAGIALFGLFILSLFSIFD